MRLEELKSIMGSEFDAVCQERDELLAHHELVSRLSCWHITSRQGYPKVTHPCRWVSIYFFESLCFLGRGPNESRP